jgi:hypothetical protein
MQETYRKTPFRLVYGQEAVVPLEYLIPSLCIATITNMTERGTTQEILSQLMELEEDMIMVGFHQEVQKEKDKSWHDRHIKKKNLRKEIWFSSMTVNIYNTQENSGCIG